MIDFDLLTLIIMIGIYLLLIIFLPKKNKFTYIYSTLLFFYSAMLISVTLFPVFQADDGNTVYYNAQMHFIPFSDGINKTDLLNIFMFVPYGVLLPIVFKPLKSSKLTILTAAITSLIIELLQLVEITGITGYVSSRVVDIDDLIFNTLGAVIGYLIYFVICRIAKKKQNKVSNAFVNDLKERFTI